LQDGPQKGTKPNFTNASKIFKVNISVPNCLPQIEYLLKISKILKVEYICNNWSDPNLQLTLRLPNETLKSFETDYISNQWHAKVLKHPSVIN
jgi:hypothetical protein